MAVSKHQRALQGHAVAEVQAGQEGFELHRHVAAREAVRREGVKGRHTSHRGDRCNPSEVAEMSGAAAVLVGKDAGDNLGAVVYTRSGRTWTMI